MQMTVFLTTHYMEEAAAASHIGIMDNGKLKQYGTPFSLKESFASDRLNVMAKDKEKVIEILRNKKLVFKEDNRMLSIELNNTLAALTILPSIEDAISGFEVIQGSMDDVFLNVTGKALAH